MYWYKSNDSPPADVVRSELYCYKTKPSKEFIDKHRLTFEMYETISKIKDIKTNVLD